MNVKGVIAEYPLRHVQSVKIGYNTCDFYYDATVLPSEELGAVMELTENRRLNLVFSDKRERDEFVVCMGVLVRDKDGGFVSLGSGVGAGGEGLEGNLW